MSQGLWVSALLLRLASRSIKCYCYYRWRYILAEFSRKQIDYDRRYLDNTAIAMVLDSKYYLDYVFILGVDTQKVQVGGI